MIRAIRRRIEFAQFCTIHRRSLSAIHRWQVKQLRRLVRHAYLHVPLWHEILSKAHIDGGHIKSLADLPRIPLTSKAAYIGRMVEEYIDSSHRFIQRWGATSGSSGKPFQFLFASQYARYTFYSEFSSFRFLLWNGKGLKAITTTRIARIKRKVYSSAFRLGLNYADFREDPRKAYLQLAEFKPEVLMAYPSVLLDIARMVEGDKTLPSLMPRYILSTGEMLTPSVRSFISKQLSSEVYDRYGIEEFGVIGTECSVHDGFHINSESIIVEITDELGNPLPEGAYGKVVITDLFNYNMPFIRYDIGDRGSLSFESCACGLHTPRIWLKGRSSVYLTFGSHRIYRYELVTLDALMHQVFQYQVVKRDENELLLRVVPGTVWDNSIIRKIEEGARQYIGNDIRISIELVPGISKAPSGKYNLLVDETVSATTLLIT